MKKIRYGVVGAGWISQDAFMPAVGQTSNSELSAICSGNADGASALADFYGLAHVYDYAGFDRMLADDVVDAVYIALPNSMHADYAIRAARAGKHILCEKPLAISVAECEAMIAAAAEAGVTLATAYRLHADPGTTSALDQIHQGAIGTPRYFSSVFSFQADAGNHRLLAEHWGGPLQDIGIYCLNAARHCFGAEPIEAMAVKGHGEGDPRFTQVEETIAVTLRFPQERFAQFTVSFGTDAIAQFKVIGSTGILTMDPAYDFRMDTAWKIEKAGVESTAFMTPGIDQFGALTEYVSDCIRTGTRPVCDGEEGLADIRALLAIEQAALTGQPQAIETPPRPAHPGADTARSIPRTDRRLLL